MVFAYLDKMKKENKNLSLVKSVLLIFISISIAVAGQILLKIGMNRIGMVSLGGFGGLKQLFLAITKSPVVLSGLFLYILSAAFWLVVLSAVDLSFAYPFIGFSYVLVLILSKFILREDVNPLRWVGALVITAGVIILSRG
jgi:multidrug transporter EmrE-like cation transporter